MGKLLIHYLNYLLLISSAISQDDFGGFGENLDDLAFFNPNDSKEDDNRKPINFDYIEGEFPRTTSDKEKAPEPFNAFFGQNYFNPLPGFGGLDLSGFNIFNNFMQQQFPVPWHQGPNVCTSLTEEEEEDSSNNPIINETFAHHFSLNVESCHETTTKYICKRIDNLDGRKKVLTTSRFCCHGFIRKKNYGFCESYKLRSITEIATDLGAKQFVDFIENNNMKDVLNKNATYFMPSDESFKELLQSTEDNDIGMVNEDKSSALKNMVLQHISDGIINLDDVNNEQILKSEVENGTIRINVYPKIRKENENRYYQYTANCVPILKANENEYATNGIVYSIQKPLAFVDQNIMEIIRKREDMTIFRSMLEKSNMDKVLTGQQFTVFAVTDAAFEKIDKQLKRKIKEGTTCAQNLLKNHILELTFCSTAVSDEDTKVSAYNMMGQKMVFERESNVNEDEQIMNDIRPTYENRSYILINGKSRVIEEDHFASNGVLHIIDSLLETASSYPTSSLLEKKNLTIFKKLMELGNFNDEFDNLENVTYFVPTDKAFENSDIGQKWIQQMNEAPQKLKNNEELRKFLRYHITKPLLKTSELIDKMNLESSEGDNKLNIRLYSSMPSFTNILNRATINCARLIHFDYETCGSVVHQIDTVLNNPDSYLIDIIRNNQNYRKFYNLIEKFNLSSLLDEASENGYTVLVPTNNVFNEVSDWMNEKSDAELEDITKNHILKDVRCCAGIMNSVSWPFDNNSVLTISNNKLVLNRDRRPKIQNAGVSKCDVIARNGIIHEINDFINVPPKLNAPPPHNNFFNLFNRPFFFK